MKNFIALTASILILTSCAAYETLRTPFDFREKNSFDNNEIGVQLRRANESYQQGVVEKDPVLTGASGAGVEDKGAYEISVKAPIGSVMNDAERMFHDEAKKVCLGKGYKHKITSKTTHDHVEYFRNESKVTAVPSVKGIIVCDK